VGNFVKVRFASARKESKSLVKWESNLKRPDLELALGGQLKLPQRRRRDHKWVILNFGKQIIMSILWFCLIVFLLADLLK
jgi:hypothetical protein